LAIEILMPKLGLTMTAGTVLGWLKDEGDSVEVQEPLLEIETEKLSYTVESPADGTLLKKLAEAGEKYPVSSVLGYIGESGAAIPDANAETVPEAARRAEIEAKAPEPEFSPQRLETPAAVGRVFITPVAKKLAAGMGIDYRQIKGTGPNGRIVKADVLAFKAPREDVCAAEPSFTDTQTQSAGTLIPYAGLRRAVGETMLNVWKTVPMVTHQVSIGVSKLLELRETINEGIADKAERVTIGELFLKLTAAALTSMPIMNSSLTDEGIVLHGRVHLGMATALDSGLIVPVIRDACSKGLLEISREAKELAARARSGALTPDDVHGGTFTVSNLGGYGSVDYFSPIINPNQAAILGVGRITDMVVPVGGEAAVRPMIGLSLTYDHRIVDGATAAEFIKKLMKLMENPVRALL